MKCTLFYIHQKINDLNESEKVIASVGNLNLDKLEVPRVRIVCT